MGLRIFLFFLLSVLWLGCVPSRDNPKYTFSDGVYHVHTAKEKQKAYLTVMEDRLLLFSRDNTGKYDSLNYRVITLDNTATSNINMYTFSKYSFDIDFISIPLKFRPALHDFPSQLNATVNGGLFVGRRMDAYRLWRKKSPLGNWHTTLQHFGLSAGVFTGIGSAVMNPSVTRNAINAEYDAVVIPAGVTALIGYNNLTFGLAGGYDHMLNRDRKHWIYRGKPWVGFTVGLNLN